jgi:hypothetical protein
MMKHKENSMKLNRKWLGNKSTHKPKRVGHKPKIPLQLLGLPGPTEEQQSNSMDEVRRQVVLMSSRGFREALRPNPRTPSVKGNGPTVKAKQRRGATE